MMKRLTDTYVSVEVIEVVMDEAECCCDWHVRVCHIHIYM